MGLFKKAKDKRKQRKEKLAQLNKVRGELLVNTIAEYMGGYGDRKACVGFGLLSFYENQIEFTPRPASDAFTIAINKVSDINVEGKDEINRRVTATRLVALGVFALALKKKLRKRRRISLLNLLTIKRLYSVTTPLLWK